MCEHKHMVRLASQEDLKFFNGKGHYAPETLLRKMDQDEVFVLSHNDQAIGYLILEFLWSAIPYIALIRIEEEHRKKGYSRLLLRFLERYLQGKGYQALYSSSQVNEPEPQSWHRHMGFRECGILNGINEGGIGEVFFRKTI